MLTLGKYSIEVMMNDCFGKRPGLYVGDKNRMLKVGNFATEEKARIFESYLKYFCRIGKEPNGIMADMEDKG